jgi:hypothetical protein
MTDEEIMRLYELADPARDDDGARTVDAAGYLDALRTRSYDMQLIDTTEAPPKSPRDNRWVLGAIAAAAIVLIVAGALLLTRDGGDEAPATPPTTLTPVAPTTAVAPTTVEQTAGQTVEDAIALVRAHYDAANAFDAELASSFLADGVIINGETWGPERFRLGIEFAAATDEKDLLGDCTPIASQEPGVTIRCEFQYQGIRSQELGLGPFLRGSARVVVADGKITSIGSMADHSENGFEEQVWDPFNAWMEANHPGDVAALEPDLGGAEKSNATEESNQLWEQRTREYVELRLTAERIAAEFLEAFGAFDAEAAGTYLADGASTEAIVNENVQDYRQAIALYQAWGYEQQLGSCQQVTATATGLEVRCPFTYHLLGSGETGLSPYEGSYFTVTVDNETGMITDVVNTWSGDDFMREYGDAFTSWVTAHPDAEARMSIDGGPALTPESLALWEQYRHEYVQHVLAGTPTTAA